MLEIHYQSIRFIINVLRYCALYQILENCQNVTSLILKPLPIG